MMYLGSLGRMIEVSCPSSQRVETGDRYAFALTLEGKRKAQALPIPPRVWDIETPSTSRAEQVAVLRGFTQGAWGPGPFVFVPTDAPNTNMLHPGVASSDPAHLASSSLHADGPVLTDVGWSPRSVHNSSPSSPLWFGYDLIPVLPGYPVTVAAYVTGPSARVRVTWYDRAGNGLTSETSTITGSASTLVRSWATATPPPNAVACRMSALDTAQATMPQISWTDELHPFIDGRGCPRAVVSTVSEDLTYTRPDRTYSGTSFTVTEVG